MANVTITITFLINGSAVGNTLTGVCADDNTIRNVVVSGDPGLTWAQSCSPTLKMRVSVSETLAGTDISLYEINPPVVTFTPSAPPVMIGPPRDGTSSGRTRNRRGYD